MASVSALCFQNHSNFASQIVKMPNLEDITVTAENPVVHLKAMQKKRAKRVLPNWINMLAADQMSTTKSTTSSGQAMGLDRRRTKRVLPNWINMLTADPMSTTQSTTSSDHSMGLDRKSKQISKRGKKKFQKVSIV